MLSCCSSEGLSGLTEPCLCLNVTPSIKFLPVPSHPLLLVPFRCKDALPTHRYRELVHLPSLYTARCHYSEGAPSNVQVSSPRLSSNLERTVLRISSLKYFDLHYRLLPSCRKISVCWNNEMDLNR